MSARISEVTREALLAAPEVVAREAQDRTQRIRKRVKLAIITALPKEAAAVRAVLGGKYTELPTQRRTQVSYYLHSFKSSLNGAELEVLLALANGMGNNSAAVTGASVLIDFPGVTDLVLAGIAGAIPVPHAAQRSRKEYERHVRLGDIVVSTEGVFQYDFIKRGLDTSECRKPAPPPSAKLINAVQKIRVDEEGGVYPWEAFLSQAIAQDGVRRPKKDRIDDDDATRKHPRNQPGRRPGSPLVHYGLIGSANVLLKDFKERDRLGRVHGLRAVEMEGSGIADAAWNLAAGYIAVRSTCDYCNSKKDDPWQRYAAFAAASYARLIVEHSLNTVPITFAPPLLTGPAAVPSASP